MSLAQRISDLATRVASEIKLTRNNWAKLRVDVATTGNITLSGLQTIDGIGVGAGARVLVKDQTNPAQNGIYTVVTPGAWVRTLDADDAASMGGVMVSVLVGTANGGLIYKTGFKGDSTLGTTAMNWEVVLSIPYGGVLPIALGGTGGSNNYAARYSLATPGARNGLVPFLAAGTWTTITVNALMYDLGYTINFVDATTDENVSLDYRSTATGTLQVRSNVDVAANTIRYIIVAIGE